MQTMSDILLFTSLPQCLPHKEVDEAIEQASCRILSPRRLISPCALVSIGRQRAVGRTRDQDVLCVARVSCGTNHTRNV